MTRWSAVALAAALALSPAVSTLHAQRDTVGKGAKKAREKDAKPLTAADSAAAEAKKLEERAQKAAKANARPLFATTEPLAFTLIANYGALGKDRDTLSTKRFQGTLVVADSSGAERRIPVTLRTRGHFRLMSRNCRFVPLRIDFPDSGLKGTPFAGQKGLKLGTHCQNGDDRYDRYTRKEYLAYRMYNAITDRSFRARLARGTYVDSTTGKPVASQTALFIESEDDLSARIGAKIREVRGATFDDLDRPLLLLASLYEFAIGNTDVSFYALHNARLAQHPEGTMLPLIYDFDFSGLVNAHYATPDPRMGIKTVRERRYRGPCWPEDEYKAAVGVYLQRKGAVMDAIAAVPGLDRGDQDDAREYLTSFYQMIENPGRLRREIIEACERKGGI